MAKKTDSEELTVLDSDPGYVPPNEQQTGEPGVAASESHAVASGLGNLPDNEPAEDVFVPQRGPEDE